ncbi:MAG TPA: diaminopimelate decarboxylase [Planctomycetota bacterium]|nr:diaminopimelate decarboxylase [Planctomycetota bacterium]
MEASLRDSLVSAAKTYGTPVYVYDKATILERCRSLQDAITFPKKKLLYAMKANSNQAVVRTILSAGFGLDCVSLGEVLFALQLGADRILYTNNNVADDEFNAVVKLSKETGKIWINCDSIQRLGDLPEGSSCFARINGPVGGGHHDHVITCGPESKFGIPWEHVPEMLKVAAARKLKLVGVHQHIGSGIREVEKFSQAMEILLSVLRKHKLPDLETVNFGGGIGVPYRPTEKPIDLKSFGAMLSTNFSAFCKEAGKDLTLVLEPGRFPVAESGYLVTKVNTIKETPYSKTFVGVDSGFNHLVRPTMYGSYHHITNLTNPNGAPKAYYVAGNICESGDIFTRGSGDDNHAASRDLPEVRRGDLLVLHNAGAYGYVMASEYNMRPRPPEVLLDGKELKLARRAKSWDEMVKEALG